MQNMTVRSFAALHDVDERTVQRWLKAGKLTGAVKTNKGWVIPADAAAPQPHAAGSSVVQAAAPVPAGPAPVALPQGGGGLSAYLDTLPAFVPLAQAALLLGITEAAISRNREELGVRPWGFNGGLVVPVRTVRHNAGL